MKFLNISEIAEVISGQSPPSSTYNDNGVGLPFYQGKTDFGVKNPIPRKWCSKPKSIAEENDILMSVRAPVGPVNIASEKSAIGRGLAAIRVKKNNDSRYLYYYLRNNPLLISRYATGSTFSAISRKEISKINIPIPNDSNDQKRIAQVLSNCESLIQKRKESIALLDTLLKSAFLEMFGDPRTNSKNWEMKPVVKYADCIVPGRDKPKDFTGQTLWITTKDLEHLSYTSKSKSNKGLSNIEIEQVRAKIIPKNSVLMTCVGDLGVVSIAGENMVVNQQLHTFQCNKKINNIFLMFNLSFQTHYMYKMASTTTLPYLNKTNCNSIPVIKPPIGLQNKFAAIVEKVETIKQSYQAHLQELENLYGSISQEAFKGELDLSTINIPDSDLIKGSVKVEPKFSGEITTVDDNDIVVYNSTNLSKKDKSEFFKKKIIEFFSNNTGTYNDFISDYLSRYENKYVAHDHDLMKKELLKLVKGKNSVLDQFFEESDNTIKLRINETA